MRHTRWICAVGVLLICACKASPQGSPISKDRGPAAIPVQSTLCERSAILKLDRGDWMVNQGSRVWKVMVSRAANRPPEHIGYVVERQYRQMRGGPEFQIYNVTTLDRNEQIGHLDQLGRGIRYEPSRNGRFTEKSVGINTREKTVAAIFETNDTVTLQPTSERRLAFEALDVNGDGVLQANESGSFGDRVAGADTNRDGVVDFQEFNAVDVL
jgi:hypothetical protein